MRYRVIYLSLLLLAACAPTSEIAEEATAEPGPLHTETAEPSPTTRPTSTPMPTTEVLPTPTFNPRMCEYPVSAYGGKKLPDLDSLHWEDKGNGVRWLTGMEYPARYVIASPDGHELAVTFALGNEHQMPISATALIDTQGNDHRWLSTDSRAYERLYRWLPDGRLLWLDTDGQLFIDDRNLNAPVPMYAIMAEARQIAFLFPKNWQDSTWRVDLNTGQWERITTPAGGPIYVVAASADAGYALMNTSESGLEDQGYKFRVWKVPLNLGASPEPVFDYWIQLVGTDAYLSTRSAQLAGTNIWMVGGLFDLQMPNMVVEYYRLLLDLDAKKVLAAQDLGLDPKYYLVGADTSPDGQWIAVSLTDNPRFELPSLEAIPDDLYLTSGAAKGGIWMADHVLNGWAPGAALVQDRATSELALIQLPSGSAIPLPGAGEGVPIYAPDQIRLPEGVVVRSLANPMEFMRFDLAGALHNTLDLSSDFNVLLPWTTITKDSIYLDLMQVGVGADGTCVDSAFTIVAWNMNP